MADGAGAERSLQNGAERGSQGVLVLCTANVCRSPAAAALLRRRLAGARPAVPVSSAGLLPGGSPALPEMRAVMDGYGADLAGHVSRTVAAPDLAGAALVIAMAREHLRHAVVLAPECWPVAFTLKELLRRGERAGPRRPGETVPGWLARVHEGREKRALLGASPEDDVPDPAGGPPEGYAATAGLLDRLTARLAGLCWVPGG